MTNVKILQLGKNKITDNFIETLRNHFKNCKSVRISVLKNARENGKTDVKKYAAEIEKKLGRNFKAKTIGFVIAVKKLRN
jgi:RNA-binding protein YhbY